MKKNSRKHRKLQKEQAMRANQVQQKAGAPFSKRKIRECRHEGVGRDLETFKRHRYTHLQPISDKECQCSECKVIFPIELYEKSCISDIIMWQKIKLNISNRMKILDMKKNRLKLKNILRYFMLKMKLQEN